MTEREVKLDSCLLLAEHLGLPKAAEGSNFVFSPLSIRAALSLVAAGSGGKTLKQMLTFLGSATVADLNSSVAALLGSVRELAQSSDGSSVGSQLSFVNGIWVDQTMALKSSFQQTATSLYSATAKSVDFRTQAEKVEVEVNDFVAKSTNGLIKDLLPKGSVNGGTQFILANALYFKGLWANNFNSSETRSEEFHLLDGSTRKVPFMTSEKDQFISEFDGFKVLRLPYQVPADQKQRSFSMLIFLPDHRDGLSRLIQKAVSEPNFLNRHFPNEKVAVSKFMIPKFKISSDFDAAGVLKVLGLNIPFDGEANFSKMVLDPTKRLHVSSVLHKATAGVLNFLGLNSPFGGQANFSEMVSDPTNSLHISSVLHKATVEVEQEGTVAAAATAVIFVTACYIPSSVPLVNFEANHPFMFAIREEVTGAVMFLGHVADPSIV